MCLSLVGIFMMAKHDLFDYCCLTIKKTWSIPPFLFLPSDLIQDDRPIPGLFAAGEAVLRRWPPVMFVVIKPSIDVSTMKPSGLAFKTNYQLM